MSDLDEDRRVTRRAQYLAATTVLSERQAEALAWSELGYSVGGVADRMGSSDGTVKNYHSLAVARFGVGAVGATTEWAEEADLTPVTVDELEAYAQPVLRQWVEKAADNRDETPDAAFEYAAARSPLLDGEDDSGRRAAREGGA